MARQLSSGPLERCLPDAPAMAFDRRDELQDRFVRSLIPTRPVPGKPLDVPLYWQQWKLDVPALAVVAETVVAAAGEALHPQR